MRQQRDNNGGNNSGRDVIALAVTRQALDSKMRVGRGGGGRSDHGGWNVVAGGLGGG